MPRPSFTFPEQLTLQPVRSIDLFYMLVLFSAYLAAAQAGHLLTGTTFMSPAFIWPAAGIAVAGIVLGGGALWPAIALASFINSVLIHSPLSLAVALAVANVLQALFAGYLLRKLHFDTLLSHLQDIFALTLTALLATPIVPLIGTTTRLFLGLITTSEVTSTWNSWYAGEVLSVLIITPFVVRWLPRLRFRRTKREWTEAGVAFALLALIDVVLFWTPYTEFARIPLVYLIFLPLMWIGLRIGPRAMTLALLMNAGLILSGVMYGATAAYSTPTSIADHLFQSELFVIMISFIFYVLVATAEERKDSANDLRDHVRRLEYALERIQKEDSAKGQFIATLAHELRNPLAPLMSSLEIFKLSAPSANDAETLVDGMIGHIKTMRHLLDDLLDISRVSRKKFVLQKECVELQAIVNQSVRTVTPLYEERGHDLVVSLPESALLFEADPVRLEQILVNLLNNSAKYTDPGGTVSLDASLSGDVITLRVRDTGRGIDPALIEHIFEPFLQIYQQPKSSGGIGIGLSLTRNLVEMHGGSIRAFSEGAGQGSEFTVRIPFIHRTKEDTMATGGQASLSDTRKTILVVDDNEAAARALQKLLMIRYHDARTAADGGEALRMVTDFEPEVVILDIGLPDMDGYQVARILRQQNKPLKALIALSGYGQDEDKRKAIEAGFDYHLTKPVGLSEIEEILNTLS